MSKDCRVAYDITDYLCRHGAEVGAARAVILGAYNGLKIRVFAEAFQHLYVIDDGNSDYRCTEPVLGETSNEVIEAMDFTQANITLIPAAPEDSWTKKTILGPVEFVFFQYHLSYVPLSLDLIWYSQLPGVRFLGGSLFGTSNSDVKRAVLGYLGVPDKIFDDNTWIKQIAP
jgi:hypothetical protein